MSLEKHTLVKENNNTTIRALSCEEIESRFNVIFKGRMRELGNGHKAVDVESPSGNYVIEIIEYCEHFVVAKIIADLIKAL